MHPSIIAYYLLCGVTSPRLPHIASAALHQPHAKLYNKKELMMYFRADDGNNDVLYSRETIIGGDEGESDDDAGDMSTSVNTPIVIIS